MILECCTQRKRETSDTDGESSLPNTPSVHDGKKEKKKKKVKHQEADREGLGQEMEMEVWSLNCCWPNLQFVFMEGYFWSNMKRPTFLTEHWNSVGG